MSKTRKLSMIDYDKQVYITPKLISTNNPNDETNIEELTKKLTDYVLEVIGNGTDKTHILKTQLLPLMSHVVMHMLIRMVGEENASIYLASNAWRLLFIYTSMISFYMCKFLDISGIDITTEEIPISKEEIEQYERITVANDICTTATITGIDPKTVIKKMIKEGFIKIEDVEKLGYQQEDFYDKKKDTN